MNRTTSFGYDGNGNLLSITRPAVSGGTPVTGFTYTGQGLPAAKTDPDGMVTHFGYNGTGDLISATLNYGGLNLTTQLGYDAAGNPASITDPARQYHQFHFQQSAADRAGHGARHPIATLLTSDTTRTAT